jgi:hypothetical protein
MDILRMIRELRACRVCQGEAGLQGLCRDCAYEHRHLMRETRRLLVAEALEQEVTAWTIRPPGPWFRHSSG